MGNWRDESPAEREARHQLGRDLKQSMLSLGRGLFFELGQKAVQVAKEWHASEDSQVARDIHRAIDGDLGGMLTMAEILAANALSERYLTPEERERVRQHYEARHGRR